LYIKQLKNITDGSYFVLLGCTFCIVELSILKQNALVIFGYSTPLAQSVTKPADPATLLCLFDLNNTVLFRKICSKIKTQKYLFFCKNDLFCKKNLNPEKYVIQS